MPVQPREALEKEFFSRIPKARKINPQYRGFFDLMYQAHEAARPGKRLLNIYASWDLSGDREAVYREKFFDECEYEMLDFKEDRFIPDLSEDVVGMGDGQKKGTGSAGITGLQKGAGHVIPYPDNSFDIIVTTKYIFEHISDPQKVVKEFHRVLKPGGEVFTIAAHIRRQHQVPWDYYRYTEYILDKLFREAGFCEVILTPTNGFLATAASYAYFFQRGLGAPRWIERSFDWLHYWVLEPVLYTLDRLDNGYGRDMTMYFLVRARS